MLLRCAALLDRSHVIPASKRSPIWPASAERAADCLRLAGAWGSQRDDLALTVASGAPAGPSLRHLALNMAVCWSSMPRPIEPLMRARLTTKRLVLSRKAGGASFSSSGALRLGAMMSRLNALGEAPPTSKRTDSANRDRAPFGAEAHRGVPCFVPAPTPCSLSRPSPPRPSCCSGPPRRPASSMWRHLRRRPPW
jgi:hypothetical protein